MSPRISPLALAGAFLALACGSPTPDPVGTDWAPHLGLTLEPLHGVAVELAYQAPRSTCPHVYRLETAYDVLPLQEERNRSLLLLAPHTRRGTFRPAEGPPAADQVLPGDLFYLGFRAGKGGARRDMFFGRDAVGPAAPTAACTARTWDPMEDALALGFPELTGRLTATGEVWSGGRVEGKCNKTACIDPETFAGGLDNHSRPCVTMSFEERLRGVFEVNGQTVAALESSWSDGHGTQGIWAERVTLFSVDHGRPIWSSTTIHHTFPQPTADRKFGPIERTWTLTAIDSCGGSVVDLQGSPMPQQAEEISRIVEARDAFQTRQRDARSGRRTE